jgi:hypothetical protein
MNPSIVNPPAQTKQRWRKKLFVINQEISKHRGITRKPEYLLKLYSRELSSTIDRYKNGKIAYIYSKHNSSGTKKMH